VPSTSITFHRVPTRRGVLLLVVLSLLTLFLLLGTTFLVLSSRARTTARAFVKLTENPVRASEAYEPMLRRAVRQVIRGGTANSALRSHDLLADRYGIDTSERFIISGPDSAVPNSQPMLVAGNQVLRLRFKRGESLPGSLAPRANRSGRVLTFISGPGSVVGTSCRIITSLEADGRVSDFAYVPRPPRLVQSDLAQLSGKAVLINGRDFQGPGFTPDEAMLPNWSLVTLGPEGQPNEDYDARDVQNWALPGKDGISFHRPRLIQKAAGALLSKVGTWAADADPQDPALPAERLFALPPRDVLPQHINIRRASLRPFAFDHSPDGVVDFAGRPLSAGPSSTASLEVLELVDPDGDGPETVVSVFGDVDTDGDGLKDSIWMDLGQPPVLLPNKSLVKPLFAIKCVDLGGRLNLNVHGSTTHLQRMPNLDSAVNSGNSPPVGLVRPGLGFSPLDVRLDPVLDPIVYSNGDLNPDPDVTEVTRLAAIQDRLRAVLDRLPAQQYRFGGDGGDGLTRSFTPLAGRYGFLREPLLPRFPGSSWQGDPVPDYWLGLLPSDRAAGLFRGGPPDLWSRLVVAIDTQGRPLFLPMSQTESLKEGESPSRLDLARPKNADPLTTGLDVPQPYSPAELAALLCRYDSNTAAALPQRLIALDLATNGRLRNTCTTESWDTPAVIGPLPRFVGAAGREVDHDLARGLRMNLNRPFGDGMDNDGDGVVDEPDEPGNFAESNDAPGNQRVLERLCRMSASDLGATLPPQYGPDVPGLRARQLFAFQLFKLLDGVRKTFSAPGKLLDLGRQPPAVPPNPNAIENRTRRVLAQWVVNVVDFMDPDAVMTSFRYGDTDDQVVWGCEAPDLIVTETLGIHDRGIADTAAHGNFVEPPNDPDDGGWDQVRRPRGSVFLELSAIRRAAAPAALPPELYTPQGELDLARCPPLDPDDPSKGFDETPVWRLGLTTIRPDDPNSMIALMARLTEQVGLPDQPPPLPTDHPILEPEQDPSSHELDRFVWFCTPPMPANSGPWVPPMSDIFHPQPNNPSATRIRPGGYLVIGPRTSTPFGDLDRPGPVADSPQGIHFNNAGDLWLTDLDGQQLPSRGQPLTRVCVVQANDPGRTYVSGLNVSEPPVDSPLTRYPSDPVGPDDPNPWPRDLEYHDPTDPSRDRKEGTRPNAAMVYIQRLADPTRPHDPRRMIVITLPNGEEVRVPNPAWNPYMTVDFQPIDLHVMNGSTEADATARWHFHTRQRGLATGASGTPVGIGVLPTFLNSRGVAITANPWVPVRPSNPIENHPPGPRHDVAANPATSHFPYQLNVPSNPDLADTWPKQTLGYTNISFGSERPDGSPSTPFPWIVWNDRPFANEYELLLVPRTSASRLLTDYRNPAADPTGGPAQQPNPPAPAAPDAWGVASRAGHLLPFTAINDTPPMPNTASAPDILSRLFAFVRVASPLAGTTTPLTDFAIVNTAIGKQNPNNPTWDHFEKQYRAPFNAIPTLREPGRVNLNTVPRDFNGQAIWNGILGMPDATARLAAAPTWLDPEPPIPPSLHQVWHQVAQAVDPAAPPFQDDPHPILRQRFDMIRIGGTDASPRTFSLLREPAPRRPAPPPPPDEPPPPPLPPSLFGPPAQAIAPAGGSDPQYRYEERNAWFAYEPLIRAASNTTPRSEVYAIWVTMGFFEVEAVDPELKKYRSLPVLRPRDSFSPYPDGYKLLREHGSDTGDVRRHRAFYLIDRSIPVGYESGVDHNVSNVIIAESLVD
jgi:hypothetical protein